MKTYFHSQVDRLYFSHKCGHGHFHELPEPVEEPETFFWEQLSWEQIYSNVEQLYQDIKAGRMPAEELDEDLVKRYVRNLSQPFKPLIKTNFDAPDYSEPNWRFIREVNSNLYHFAGAKSYRAIKALNDLFTKNGRVVEFPEFRRNVEKYREGTLKIKEQYERNWLRAEHTHAVRTARSAERWQRAEELRDIYPNLIYKATNDSRVRDSHQLLDGTIRPIDDAFWDTYTPPNGWNCRCRVEPTDRAPTGGSPSIDNESMFSGNPAKTGVIFKEDHTYFVKNERLKAQIRERSTDMARQVYIERQRTVFDRYRGSKQYIPQRFDADSGGFLVLHRQHGRINQQEREMMDDLVRRGDGVVAPKYTNDPFTPNPDVQVNGTLFDIKQVAGTTNSVVQALQRGATQARFVLLEVKNLSGVVPGIREFLRKNPKDVSGILLVHGGKREMIDRRTLQGSDLEEVVKKLK